MDFSELTKKERAELLEELAKAEAELHSLRQRALRRELKEVHAIKPLRRTIARIRLLLAKKPSVSAQ